MNRVLFVDDEPNILDGIRRMLRPYRKEWEFKLANSAQEAIDLMIEQPFDIIVSDMRMPGMNGVELLKHTKAHHPQTIRFALTGHAETEMELECAQMAHQFLMKPVSTEVLLSTMQAALKLQEALNDETLTQALSGLDALPSLPALYQKVLSIISSPDGTLQEVGDTISKDVAMTAKVLQLVNSSFFGLGRQVSSPGQAATMLGADIIKSLILSNQVFQAFKEGAQDQLNLEQLTLHCQQVGSVAGKVASQLGMTKKYSDMAFMSGMLHDIGKLILAVHAGYSYRQGTSSQDYHNETAKLQTTHAHAGAFLLGIWGLPNALVEAVLYHHEPSKCAAKSISPLTATHIAGALVDLLNNPDDSLSFEDYLDMDYLKELGIEGMTEAWHELALDLLKPQEQALHKQTS